MLFVNLFTGCLFLAQFCSPATVLPLQLLGKGFDSYTDHDVQAQRLELLRPRTTVLEFGMRVWSDSMLQARYTPIISASALHAIEGKGYRVLSELGRGGMGVVYLAEKRGVRYGIKVPIQDQERMNLLLEARALSDIDKQPHPNILRFQDVVRFKDERGIYQWFMVVEFCRGGDLANHLKDIKKDAVAMTFQGMKGVVRGLLHLRKLNYNHGDIKPANILISSPGSWKLADFGLAQEGRIGNVPGATKSYLAPEGVTAMKMQKKVDLEKIDVFALGVTFYEVLTGGKQPWEPESEKKHAVQSKAWVTRKMQQQHYNLFSRMFDPNPSSRATLVEVYTLLQDLR